MNWPGEKDAIMMGHKGVGLLWNLGYIHGTCHDAAMTTFWFWGISNRMNKWLNHNTNSQCRRMNWLGEKDAITMGHKGVGLLWNLGYIHGTCHDARDLGRMMFPYWWNGQGMQSFDRLTSLERENARLYLLIDCPPTDTNFCFLRFWLPRNWSIRSWLTTICSHSRWRY
jgi:hypothetical protein